MICPFCKNEKLNQDVCPSCGLDEERAILEAALGCQKGEKWTQAVEYYGKYLRKRPQDLRAKRGAAFCWWKQALHLGTPESCERAERELAQVLSEDWDWEVGHQYRIQLSAFHGTASGLKEEYWRIAQTDAARRPVAEEVLRVLQLTEQFREQLPRQVTSLPVEQDWRALLGVFSPLLAGLLLSAVFSSVFLSGERTAKAIYEFLSMILFFDFSLFVLSFYLYRKLRLKGRKKENENNIGSPGFPNLPHQD